MRYPTYLIAITSVALTLSCEMPTPIEPPPADGFGAQTIPDIDATVNRPINPVTMPKATHWGYIDEHTANYEIRRRLSDDEDPFDIRVVTGLPPGLSISDFVLSGTPTTPQDTETYDWVYDGPANYKLTFSITIDVPMTEPRTTEIANTYTGRGNAVFFLNPDGQRLSDTPYTLRLGHNTADVYLVSTNTNHYETHQQIKRLDRRENRVNKPITRWSTSATYKLSETDYLLPASNSSSISAPSSHAPSVSNMSDQFVQSWQTAAEGDTYSFYVQCNSFLCPRVRATARRVVTDGTVTLTIWVADEMNAYPVQQSDLDEIAHSFLRHGSGNDIYDWMTAAFGEPWGPHNQPDRYIPSDAASKIHVLLQEIPGRASGVFSGNDTYLSGATSITNEKLMFYADRRLSVVGHLSIWAHEFQHMIAHYQKGVKNEPGAGQGSFVEMTALVAQDLIADKIKFNSPVRLLAIYNCHNDYGAPPRLRFWDDWDKAYALSYALGAYLARNYGGAPLLRDIVQNSEYGIGAIEAGLRAQGHAVSFEDVLMNWAVATLLSDDPQAPYPYQYNTWSTSVAGGVTFRLSPINLYEHELPSACGGGHGPFAFSISQFNAEGAQVPYSNRYVFLGRDTGTVRLRLTGDYGNRFTVVVKE